MNTHSIIKFISEPDSSGDKVVTFCLFVSGVIGLTAGGLLGVLRLAGGHKTAAGIYISLCVLSAVLLTFLIYKIKRGNLNSVSRLSIPVTVIGFIFGLSALFFADGGVGGGVPVFFIMAVVITPCFLNLKDALVMISLEIGAYVLNVIFASLYPESINSSLSQTNGNIIPIFIVTLLLGILGVLYTYVFRHQQRRLDSAISQAESANEAKSSFLNNMSHEIRTPMNSILGMNEMILREEERPEIREYALVIQRSGRALLGIINDVLDFSKLQDNKMEIMPVRYDLSSLINDLVSIAAEQAKKKSLIFTVNVDKEIPGTLDGDEYHIRQVLMNILNNAIKYTERGGVTLTIGYRPLDSYSILLTCSVSDTGVGIKEEDMEHIFQPFEHIESSRRFSADGSGLGLSIVQKILYLMGSELKVESVFHQGSKFSFEIKQTVIKWEPIGDYERAFSMAATRQHGGSFSHSFQAPKAKILVVDDADVNLLVFANLLKKTKIKIDTASSGLEMLQMVRMNHYDMIFLDHRMPGMDGIEAFHNMKNMTDGLNYNTPVVALTANAVLGARQLYIDEGFSDYISKPVDTVRLEQILLEYLPDNLIENVDESSDEKISENISKPVESYEEYKEESESESESSPYKNIPGIDYEAAVTNCGTEDTFIQALEIFYNTIDKKADEIEKFEKDNDIKNYTVKVHALKSAARLVGALELSADAKYLEECGDKNDVGEIESKTPALLYKYRSYKNVLAEVFGKNDEVDMSLPEISTADLQEMYSLIKGFAEDFDLDNIDKLIDEAKNYRIPESEREKFEKIKECVTNADWGGLESLL